MFFVGVHMHTTSFGHEPRSRIAGAIGSLMFSFHIAKQCVHHFILVSAVHDSSSFSSPTLGVFCLQHIVKLLCSVFQILTPSKPQIVFPSDSTSFLILLFLLLAPLPLPTLYTCYLFPKDPSLLLLF